MRISRHEDEALDVLQEGRVPIRREGTAGVVGLVAQILRISQHAGLEDTVNNGIGDAELPKGLWSAQAVINSWSKLTRAKPFWENAMLMPESFSS